MEPSMRDIVSDILTWPWFSEPHGYTFNGHLVRHAEGNLCIDPVEPDEEVVDEMARLGVAQILLTNRNHSRAANTELHLYRHTAEGRDDMPAHIKGALTQTQLSIPVSGGQMMLGTYQGLYVFEHRRVPRTRELVLHLIGQ